MRLIKINSHIFNSPYKTYWYRFQNVSWVCIAGLVCDDAQGAFLDNTDLYPASFDRVYPDRGAIGPACRAGLCSVIGQSPGAGQQSPGRPFSRQPAQPSPRARCSRSASANAEASPNNFKMSTDGTVATILFDKDSIDAMKTVIAQMEQNGVLGKVKGVVYSSAGITPMLVLMGEKDELTQKLVILRQFIPDQSQAHMVVISASLRELQDEDAYYVGLTLSPDILGITLGGAGATATFQNFEAGDLNLKTQYSTTIAAQFPSNFTFSRIAQFQEAYNRGKVLVASEVYTRNGTKALLTNIQSIPIFTVDSNKNVATQYQNLETSVDVIPTTIEYNKEKPAGEPGKDRCPGKDKRRDRDPII